MRPGRAGSRKSTMLGWGMSGLLHGVILTAATVSVHVAAPHAIPYHEPFRWEVSLSAAPRSEAVVSDGFQSSAGASLPEARSSDSQDAPALTQMVDLPSVRHDDGRRSRTPHPIAPADNRVSQLAPVFPDRPTDVHPPRQSVVTAATSPTASFTPPPELASERESDNVEVETVPEPVTVLQRPQAVTHDLVNRTIRPDYGWLMETLRSKLEDVKSYPAAARAVHAQGLVVVQVRIDGDGLLTAPEIKESSGSTVLDRAALAAVQAASPLRLDHRLEGAPLVMLVPLHYRLE